MQIISSETLNESSSFIYCVKSVGATKIIASQHESYLYVMNRQLMSHIFGLNLKDVFSILFPFSMNF